MAWPSTDITDFGQFQIQGTLWNGQAFRNTFAFWGHDTAEGLDPTVLKNFLSSGFMDSLIGAYRAAMSTSSTLDGVLARQVHDPVNPAVSKHEAFRTVALAGTSTATLNGPSEPCGVLHLGTDAAGRSAHGRVFLPTVGNRDNMNGEVWDSSIIGLWNAIATVLVTLTYPSAGSHAGGGAADIDLAVFSATLRRRAPADLFAFRVTALQVRPRIHWLRSRGPRG